MMLSWDRVYPLPISDGLYVFWLSFEVKFFLCLTVHTVCSLEIITPQGTPVAHQCWFPCPSGQSFVGDVLFPSFLIVTCLCFSVCPWGNKLLPASAPQAKRESSAAVGRTSCQQELCAQSVAAVCSVSSAKQSNKGNARHVLCVSVVLMSQSQRPGGVGAGRQPHRPRSGE